QHREHALNFISLDRPTERRRRNSADSHPLRFLSNRRWFATPVSNPSLNQRKILSRSFQFGPHLANTGNSSVPQRWGSCPLLECSSWARTRAFSSSFSSRSLPNSTATLSRRALAETVDPLHSNSTIRSARRWGSSSTTNSEDRLVGSAAAVMELAATGTPIAIASIILFWSPRAMRSGTTAAEAPRR